MLTVRLEESLVFDFLIIILLSHSLSFDKRVSFGLPFYKVLQRQRVAIFSKHNLPRLSKVKLVFYASSGALMCLVDPWYGWYCIVWYDMVGMVWHG